MTLTSDPSEQWTAYECLLQGDYIRALSLYEQAIASNPASTLHYWYLGLVLLLQGQEAEAQMTWVLAMANAESEQTEIWSAELSQVLQAEAERREAIPDYQIALILRHHMREISPKNINNLFLLIHLAIELETFAENEFVLWEVIEFLQAKQTTNFDFGLLSQTLQQTLNHAALSPTAIELAKACLQYADHLPNLLTILRDTAINSCFVEQQPELAVRFTELCLNLNPKDRETLAHLAVFYQKAGYFSQAVEAAKLCYTSSQGLPDKVSANHLVLAALMTAGGHEKEVYSVLQERKSLLLSLIESQSSTLRRHEVLRLFVLAFPSSHLEDNPEQNKLIHNQVTQLCQASIEYYAKEHVKRYRQYPNCSRNGDISRPLKIGYVSSCLRSHAVGWLARGLFFHHDPSSFEIYTYFVGYRSGVVDPLQEWYAAQSTCFYKAELDGLAIAEKISSDGVDVLIDLDSITMDMCCEVMALKPAPVQATWLGFDASGLPAVDYFIADPYVLPESAQTYYTEKIWRLPQTYLAVDGFEVGIPTLRRDQLSIPSDAVVYLSAQRGYKRHPNTTRLQIKILKAVPNSYFLIKGWADQESIRSFFTQIAEEEGVAFDRLRFLPQVQYEATHRADLGIADVVLDTYPYNGATTTLETLWMGIPLVTQVGEQFAARNSYTFMMNAGVTEGIAWTDEEYVEWGVRLGRDEGLRQKIAWQLRASRQTSPLWNAKQFTREMEKAYQQMWANYLEAQ